MPTRKDFCKSCLALMLAGLGTLLPATSKEDAVKTNDKIIKEKIVGACGIVCSECPAYIATQADDDALRAKTAKEWSAMYQADIKPENINCDGCKGREAGVPMGDCPGREAGVPVGDCQGREAGVPLGDCPSAGPRLFAHCLECGIRACARGRKLATCAACPEYACQKLQEFFAMVPPARETLENIRRNEL